MNSETFMIIFDIIVFGLGIILLVQSFKMKKTKVISQLFVPGEEIGNCKDVPSFISYIFPKALVFSFICIIFGALSFVNDAVVKLNNLWNYIMLVAFLGGWFWFSRMVRKGKEQFFKRIVM